MVVPGDVTNHSPDILVVSGRDASDSRDRFVGLDSETGQQLWAYEYESVIALDYGNSPRATPAFSSGVLVLLGASGKVTGFDPTAGVPLWTLDLAKHFDVEIPTWGFSGSPLIVDGQVLVQVADKPSLISIDLFSGKVIWKVTGTPAAYSSLMLLSDGKRVVGVGDEGYFVRQIRDGKLEWSAQPTHSGDFGVQTPIVHSDGLLFASENNGIQMYPRKDSSFGVEPSTQNEDLIPDTHTPVLVGDQLLVAHDGLHGLRVDRDLQESWVLAEKKIYSYASIIASQDRALVTTEGGEWILVSLEAGKEPTMLDHRALFDEKIRLLSHPALHQDSIFVRVGKFVQCYRLSN